MYDTVLPVAVSSPATGWQLVDVRPVTARRQPAAGGSARIELEQLQTDVQWLVDRAVIHAENTTTTESRLRFYDGYVDPSQLLDGTERGNFDVSEYSAGLLIPPGSRLVAEWTGLPNGTVCALRLQVRVMRRA